MALHQESGGDDKCVDGEPAELDRKRTRIPEDLREHYKVLRCDKVESVKKYVVGKIRDVAK